MVVSRSSKAAAAAEPKSAKAAKGTKKDAGITKGGKKAQEVVVAKKKTDKDDLDDIFAKKPAKATTAAAGAGKKDAKAKSKGPDMEEIKKEEAKYKGSNKSGGRQYVDGYPVYTAEELEEEMGESAWDAFVEASEPGLK